MSDFCKECSIEFFGKDLRDLAGLISPEEVKEGYGAVTICEDCGPIRVDQDGKRMGEKLV